MAGQCTCGLYSYGLYSYGLYSYGLHSYGQWQGGAIAADVARSKFSQPISIESSCLLDNVALGGSSIFTGVVSRFPEEAWEAPQALLLLGSAIGPSERYFSVLLHTVLSFVAHTTSDVLFRRSLVSTAA